MAPGEVINFSRKNSGFSLVELIVVLGMMSVIALVMGRMMTNSFKMVNAVSVKADIESLRMSLVSYFSDPTNCDREYGPSAPTGSAILDMASIVADPANYEFSVMNRLPIVTAGTPSVDIVPSPVSPATYSVIGTSNAQISEVWIRGFQRISLPATYNARLEFVINGGTNTLGEDFSAGIKQQPASVPLVFVFNSAGAILSCGAGAMRNDMSRKEVWNGSGTGRTTPTTPPNPWTVPPGVTNIIINAWGGGGGGGTGHTRGITFGGGGGGGAWVTNRFTVTPGMKIYIVTGGGGAGGTSGSRDGGNGTSSCVTFEPDGFDTSCSSASNVIRVPGGSGGKAVTAAAGGTLARQVVHAGYYNSWSEAPGGGTRWVAPSYVFDTTYAGFIPVGPASGNVDLLPGSNGNYTASIGSAGVPPSWIPTTYTPTSGGGTQGPNGSPDFTPTNWGVTPGRAGVAPGGGGGPTNVSESVGNAGNGAPGRVTINY